MRCISVFGVRLNGRLRMRCAPRCSTFRVSTRSGARRSGGSGGPIFPQAARKTERKRGATERRGDGATRRLRKTNLASVALSPLSPRRSVAILQNVSTEIFVLHNIGQHIPHVGGVDNWCFSFRSGPSNEISSSSFSMIVCRRRAPMSSVVSLT